MLFQTTQFLVFFLAFVSIYLLVRRSYWLRNGLLLGASYLFYACWDWRFLGLIVASTVGDYYLGRLIAGSERTSARKTWLWISVITNLGLLGTFKYYDFFIASLIDFGKQTGWSFSPTLLRLALPVGISFYTFESMSYIIDVYRRKIPVSKSLLEYGVFISFFPHLVAGPIIRPATFFPSLRREPDISEDAFYNGLYLFILGLFKKLILADLLALWWVDEVFSFPQYYSPLDTLVAVYGYAFQIYNDFSAYSNMAIGLSMILGIHLPENFKSPYVSASLKEFWQRWHISLSTWLRDYLYIPMGGGRAGYIRKYLNIFVTMLLGGLWHGANWTFVVWGALHGAFITINHLFDDFIKPRFPFARIPFFFGWFVSFNAICLAWIFFRAESLQKALLISENLLGLFSNPGFYQGPIFIVVLICFCACLQFASFTQIKTFILRIFVEAPLPIRAFVCSVSIAAIIIFEQHFKPFIYFQF